MSMTEEQQQSICAIWFWNTFPSERRMLFHIDNNSYNRVIGARKKALGVVSGPSDFAFICGNGKTLWLEGKIPGGSQSPEQRDFQLKVESRGHEYIIFWSVEEFKKIITKKLADYERQ